MKYIQEFFFFLEKNIYASIYGIFLVSILIFSKYFLFTGFPRADIIFISVIFLQAVLLIFKVETKKEFTTIIVFHIIATVMELFKTADSIGSWRYTGVSESIFHIGNVPLYTGFLYSAVGSYIVRAQKFLQLEYQNFPKQKYVIVLSILIYGNFFLHHFWYDIRYVLLIAIGILFFRTYMYFQVYKKKRKIHFLIPAFLTSVCIYFVENIATFFKVWIYPNQEIAWELVDTSKITSWFLLLIVSFTVISSLIPQAFYFSQNKRKIK